MMKVKKEYLILFLAIVLLAIYLVMRPNDASHMDLPQPAGLESAKIDRIVITKEKSPIELVKKDNQWTIQPQGYAADAVQINNMLNTIAKLTLTALVSESGNYDRYALGPDTKMAVQAFSGTSKVREMDIGQVAPTFQHTFVKLENDPNVYHARGAFKNNFDQTVDSLRDKTVLTFDRESITNITVQKGASSLTLARKDITPPASAPPDTKEAKEEKPPVEPKKQWVDAQDKPVKQSEIEQLLSAMSRLQCEAFLNDKTKHDFKAPRWILTLKSNDKSYEVQVFAKVKEEDTLFPAFTSSSDYIFSLSAGRVDTFEKQIDSLLTPEKKETPR